MFTNIIVGTVFAVIVLFAFNKARKDVKNNKCAGCSGCSSKNKCNIK